MIHHLDQAIEATIDFFMRTPETLRDGNQTACQVISHPVFRHRDFARISNALAHNRMPRFLPGRLRDYSAQASEIYASDAFSTLVRRLQRCQRELHRALEQIPNWRVNFSLEEKIAYCSIGKRAQQIRAHVAVHLARRERAERTLRGRANHAKIAK